MKNWRTLFFGLLGINILFLLIILFLASQPLKENFSKRNDSIEENVDLTILAKRDHLGILINRYLRKEFQNQPLNYEIRLTERVEVYGTIQAFGNDLNIQMAFEPEVQDNGDILLRQESLSVGKLRLPVRTVLKYVNNNFKLPEWVTIQPKEESVYVALQEMELKSDFRVKVERFDLERDDIRFRLISTK